MAYIWDGNHFDLIPASSPKCAISPSNLILGNRFFKREVSREEPRKKGRLGFVPSRLGQSTISKATSSISRSKPQAPLYTNCRVPKVAPIGSRKIEVDRYCLRKAAILNNARRSSNPVNVSEKAEQENEQKDLVQGTSTTQQSAFEGPQVQEETQWPPSPVGISDYEALDREDMEEDTEIYSDFNILKPTRWGQGCYDHRIARCRTPQQELVDTVPPSPRGRGGDIARDGAWNQGRILVQQKGAARGWRTSWPGPDDVKRPKNLRSP